MLDERGAGFALGAAEYLVKPVDRDELLGALAQWTDQPGDGRTVVAIDDDPRDLELRRGGAQPARLVRAPRRRAARRASSSSDASGRASFSSTCSCPASTASRSSTASGPTRT